MQKKSAQPVVFWQKVEKEWKVLSSETLDFISGSHSDFLFRHEAGHFKNFVIPSISSVGCW